MMTADESITYTTKMEYKGIKGNWEVLEIDLADFKQVCVASDVSKSILAHIYLPERKITEELKATASLMATSYELLQVLQELLRVKEWKDEHGKDEKYLEAQPLAWSNAQKVIEKILE